MIEISDVEEILSINEIKDRYKGRWVAVKVVERDEAGQPRKARVLFHNWDAYRLRDQVGTEEVCILYAGPIPAIEGDLVMF